MFALNRPQETGYSTAKQLQSAQAALNEAARPTGSAAPSGGAAAGPHRMLSLMVETAEFHNDAVRLAAVLAGRAVTVPERNIFALWYRMLNDSKAAPSMRAETVGLDAVPPVRRWFVSHATHIQNLLCRSPRLRRMCVALKWLEDTFEPPAVAELVAPYAAAGNSSNGAAAAVRDPDLEHKIFLQLRAGRWERACQLAEQGAAQIAHIVRTGLMPAADAQKTAWLGAMPRAELFGEYEAQNKPETSITSHTADKKRNPHRLPLLLRMMEHVTTNGSHKSSSSNDTTTGAGRNRLAGVSGGAANSASSAVGLDGADATSPTSPAASSASSLSSSDYFSGIAALICGDEAGMKSACQAHFGSTAASVLQHQFRAAGNPSAASAPPLSWQDEVWSLMRSSLVAAFTVAVLRGASDSPDTTLTDLFEGVFDQPAVEAFVSAMETRCGLSGGAEQTALDDGAFDWYRAVEKNLGDGVVHRLRGLTSRLPPDSVDGVALQSLTLFLTDSAKGHISPHLFPSLTVAVAPMPNQPAPALSPFLPFCLPEQASLCHLISLACQQSLIPSGANVQSQPIFSDIICAAIATLCNPALDVHHIIPQIGRIAFYSSLTLDPVRRVHTHTAALRAMRVRFVGDLGRYEQLETNSAEGEMARRLRDTDALLHGGNVAAVDKALHSAATRMRDDSSVPMLTHDTRCENFLWKSFMSPKHQQTVAFEAVQSLQALWNENRNLSAMNDICSIWEKRLHNGDLLVAGGAVGAASNTGYDSPTKSGMSSPAASGSLMMQGAATAAAASSSFSAAAEKKSADILEIIREQFSFWNAVLRCHDYAKAVAAIVTQLQQPSHHVAGGGRQQQQQQQFLLPSRRYDLSQQMRDIIVNNVAASFDTAIKFCPKTTPTAIAACLELLAEAVRTALPHVDDDAVMTRLFQLVFGKLPALEQTHILGSASGTALPPGAAGVELLPSNNAASLMNTMRALRVAFVAQKQQRSAAAILGQQQ